MNNLCSELIRHISQYLEFNEERQFITTSKSNKEAIFEGILKLNIEFSSKLIAYVSFQEMLSGYKLKLKLNYWLFTKEREFPENILEITLLKVHIDEKAKKYFPDYISFIFKGEKKVETTGTIVTDYPLLPLDTTISIAPLITSTSMVSTTDTSISNLTYYGFTNSVIPLSLLMPGIILNPGTSISSGTTLTNSNNDYILTIQNYFNN